MFNTKSTKRKSKIKFDYKDPLSLSPFLGEGAYIQPARINRLSSNEQKKLCNAIKKAKNLSLLPDSIKSYDFFSKFSSQVSPKPFKI